MAIGRFIGNILVHCGGKLQLNVMKVKFGRMCIICQYAN